MADHSHHGADPGSSGSHHDHGHGQGEAHGHDQHAGHGESMFRDRFWLSLAFTLLVVFFSDMVQAWFGYRAPEFPGSGWVAPVLGTAVFIYGGAPFIRGAIAEIRARQPGMMLLIGMAITVAFGASVATTFGLLQLDFWWELAALVTVMLLGHWMEMRAIGQAQGAVAALAELLPDQAERVTDDGTEQVAVSELQVGDVVLVRPGGRIPADGEIVAGAAELDESMITGESRPVARAEGERVVAGTVAIDSSIRVRVEAVGDDTALAGIQRLVAQAQESKSRAQVLADRAAALLFYVALGATVVTAVGWLLVSRPDEAVSRTVAVLVIACPHALGLALPLVTAICASLAARNGIRINDRLTVERRRNVDVVRFDKTGTLTSATHRLTPIYTRRGDDDRVLALAAAVEAESEHPVARAVMEAASELGGVPAASGFRAMSGRGVEAEVDGSRVAVGGPALLAEMGVEVPEDVDRAVAEWMRRGAAVL